MARSKRRSMRATNGAHNKNKTGSSKRNREQEKKMILYAIIITVVMMVLAYVLTR